jgi:hypothetical protein
LLAVPDVTSYGARIITDSVLEVKKLLNEQRALWIEAYQKKRGESRETCAEFLHGAVPEEAASDAVANYIRVTYKTLHLGDDNNFAR